MSRFEPGQHIHLVGIGGFGISAIARILLEQGYHVSGSDVNPNSLTDALARDGATIYADHAADHVDGAEAIIVTSAAKPGHVEVQAAKDRGIPVYKRNDIIADLMEGKTVIAVAGTHGKTTTTAMIVHILRECGKDPSYIVGGIMGNTGTNAGVGEGIAFVVEADEYDEMFLGLRPNVAVITSIEYDHPDFFESEQALFDTFVKFVNCIVPDGAVIVCADDPRAKELATPSYLGRRVGVSYGLNSVAFYADEIRHDEHFTYFDANMLGMGKVPVRIPLAGIHNVRNAMAAFVVTNGIVRSPEAVANALETFKSTGRRFEVRGEVNGVLVVDDYAHHPTAVSLTLEAARMRYPNRPLWAVWQPHTFSRTEALLDEFATAFESADEVVVTDIYRSREVPTSDSITGEQVAQAIQHARVHYTGSINDTISFLADHVYSDAVIVIMSAGDAPKIGEGFLRLKGGV